MTNNIWSGNTNSAVNNLRREQAEKATEELAELVSEALKNDPRLLKELQEYTPSK